MNGCKLAYLSGHTYQEKRPPAEPRPRAGIALSIQRPHQATFDISGQQRAESIITSLDLFWWGCVHHSENSRYEFLYQVLYAILQPFFYMLKVSFFLKIQCQHEHAAPISMYSIHTAATHSINTQDRHIVLSHKIDTHDRFTG